MMRAGIVYLVLTMSALVALTGCGGKGGNQSGLRITYGENGIQQLTFNDVMLEDLERYPTDAFHIWHMKAMDAQGKSLTKEQYGWGENNNGRSWNAATHTWRYPFTWGSISLQFVQEGNTLDMNVVEKNDADSGITFQGATIYPFVLHFPSVPSGFGNAEYQHVAVNVSDPNPVADFGQSQVTAAVSAGSKPLYYGFEPAGGGTNYFPIMSSTAMDSLAASVVHVDRPVPAGSSDTFTVSLRFSSSPSSSQ